MKMITAIIRPERLDDVEHALKDVLDEGDNFRLTIDAVEGHGRQEGEVELFRGQMLKVRRVARARVMICVNDDYMEKVINALVRGARSEDGGQVGDGKIFVTELIECVRIRTQERGPEAI